MGAQLRIYRRRMRSVKATKNITKAMELISASRIVKPRALVILRRIFGGRKQRQQRPAGIVANRLYGHWPLGAFQLPCQFSLLVGARKFDKPGRILPRVLAGGNALLPRLPGEHLHVGITGRQVRDRPIAPPILANDRRWFRGIVPLEYPLIRLQLGFDRGRAKRAVRLAARLLDKFEVAQVESDRP